MLLHGNYREIIIENDDIIRLHSIEIIVVFQFKARGVRRPRGGQPQWQKFYQRKSQSYTYRWSRRGATRSNQGELAVEKEFTRRYQTCTAMDYVLLSEKTGRYLAARESSAMMTTSWDTGYLTNCCYDICTGYRVSKKSITMLRTVIVLCSLLALVRSDFLAQDNFKVENCVAANLTQSSYFSLDRCTPSLNNGSSLRVELNSTNFYNQVNYTTSNTCSGPSVVLGGTQRSDCSSQTVNGVASSLRTLPSSSFTKKPTAQDLVTLKYTSAGCTGAVVQVTVQYNRCQGATSVIACDSDNFKTVCGGDAAIVNPAPGSSAVRLAVYNLAVVVLALALMF
ncbi:hypothetical protein PROFUN_11991 [Planoprotostelium fungivorum]|uniref:Uncharacterized protein n=1 Tax=Planoprotostelium fungivorum TaxID=1890364 RepID=A0A2P6N8W4_9EUKA|nr:hypothetical protein PROFUN_11991 [Planoprotostelium fungivorum]